MMREYSNFRNVYNPKLKDHPLTHNYLSQKRGVTDICRYRQLVQNGSSANTEYKDLNI